MCQAVFMCFSHYLRIAHTGGGVSNRTGTQPAYAVFQPKQLKIEVSETYFFDIMIT